MEDVGTYILWTLYGLFYILWTFGIVRGNLVNVSPFGYFVPRKIWQPCLKIVENNRSSCNSEIKFCSEIFLDTFPPVPNFCITKI
jgi:hypothetical protein